MPKRVSHSMLDPLFVPLVPGLYRLLPIPRKFPPEGIVVFGHLVAIAGAFGFAYSVAHWWGGLLVAAGVAGNHLSDMVDGTHARSTGQCRNGGELLDHFTDPLSFSYWAIGLAVSCERLHLALAGVLCIYATAVLVSIKAKLIGRFALARFGPTEFKTMLVVYGLVMAALCAPLWGIAEDARLRVAQVFLWVLLAVGVLQLLVNLIRSVREVNAEGTPPDTTAWELSGGSAARDADGGADDGDSGEPA